MATVNGKKEILFGKDFDPEDRIKMTTNQEGYPSVTIDDKPATPLDHVDAIQEMWKGIIRAKWRVLCLRLADSDKVL